MEIDNVSLFGLVYKKNEYLPPIVSGQADGAGFKLKFKTRYGYKIFSLSTFGINKEKIFITKMGYYCFYVSLCGGIVATITMLFTNSIIALPTFLLSLVLNLGFAFIGETSCREWHALEHKSTTLLNSGRISITVENLKKMPSINIACGTNLPMLVFLLVSSLWFLSWLLPKEYYWTCEILFIIFTSSLVYSLVAYSGLHSAFFWFVISPVVAPAALISLLYQKMFFLKEPSEEKYLKTVHELCQFLSEDLQTFRS